MKLSLMKGNIHIFRSSNRGFMTVEAAIFLPIFIIGILAFAYQIKFMSIQEGVFHAFTDEARVLSAEAKINPLGAPLFESKIKNRIHEENGTNISSLDIDNFLFLYYANGTTGIISTDLNYDINVKLPIPFCKTLPVSESLIFRGFIGKEEKESPLSFEEMEKEEESELVWIFPRSGGRYHLENCTYITSEPRQLTMSSLIRNRYKSCSICDSKQMSNGSMVYCFVKAGQAYHRATCPCVDKYIISIEKKEAIKKGYSACSKCGR